MDVFDLVAKLSLDDSEAEKGLSGFAGKAGSLLGGAAKAAAGAMAAATTAVVGFTGEAVKVGASFDSSMSQVAATMGTTVDEIGELRDFAQEMGSTTSFSASQAADALNYMALAGYDAEKSMAMLPNVLNLAAAGGMELAEASDMVTDASSALGLEEKETAAMVDQMAAAASKSNTSVAQLGAAMLAVGGTAKSMAGGTTEISTALGILADNGTKGAEGGTALRNVLLGIQGDKFEKTFGELGVSAYDADGNLRPLKDTLADMNTVMAGMTEQEKTDIISNTFNKADLKNVNALLSTTTERWDELSGAIDNSAGAAQKMADTQLDNLQGDITILQSAWEGFQIAVSDKVTPALREFVQFGSDGLSRLTEAFKTGGIEGAFGELGNILQEAIGKITEALPQITGVATQLIQSLLQGITDNLPAIGSAAIQIITQLGTMIIESLPLLLSAGLQIIMQLGQAIVENLPMIVDTAMQLIQQLNQFLIDNLDILIEAGIQIILAIVLGITEKTPELMDQMIELVDKVLDTLIDNIDVIIAAGVKIIIAIIEGITKSLPKLIAKMPEIIMKLLQALVAALPQVVQGGVQIIQAIVNGMNQVMSSVVTAASEVGNKVWEGIKGVIEKAKTWGSDMINNFVAGIKEKWDALKGAVGNVAQGIKNKLGHSHPVEGPLADDYKWMPDMMDLFIEGIENNKNRLFRTVEDTFNFGEMITPPTDAAFSGSYMTSSGNVPEKNVTVILQLDKTQLGKTVFTLNNEESRRIGVNLANA